MACPKENEKKTSKLLTGFKWAGRLVVCGLAAAFLVEHRAQIKSGAKKTTSFMQKTFNDIKGKFAKK